MRSLASVIFITFTYAYNQFINLCNRINLPPCWLPLLKYSQLLAHQPVLPPSLYKGHQITSLVCLVAMLLSLQERDGKRSNNAIHSHEFILTQTQRDPDKNLSQSHPAQNPPGLSSSSSDCDKGHKVQLAFPLSSSLPLSLLLCLGSTVFIILQLGLPGSRRGDLYTSAALGLEQLSRGYRATALSPSTLCWNVTPTTPTLNTLLKTTVRKICLRNW